MFITNIALAAILVIYAVVGIKNERKKAERMKARIAQDRTVRAITRMNEVYLGSIARNLSKAKAGSCTDDLKKLLAKKGISPEKLTRKHVREILNELANTMHQSEMAITPMHDGGFMNDMNNMHMGGM